MVLMQAKGRKEETRQRILATATRLFLERGVDGVGVDAIMCECGLTHGGFYTHFRNKEDLVEQACIHAIDGVFDELGDLIVGLSEDQIFDAFVSRFLSQDTRTDTPMCPMTMLGPDVSRRENVQKAYADRIARLLALIAGELDCSPGQAALTLAALVGATALAAQTGSERAFARQILDLVRAELLVHPEDRPSAATGMFDRSPRNAGVR